MPDVDEGSAVAQKDYRGGLPVGTILGGYELISILGKGGFGITYRARDFAHNQDVAIKEYLPTALAIREGRTTVLPISTNHAEQFAWGRERFLDEARTLERLDHAPAVVRVLDFLEANGTAYMVMALVEGETLNKRLLREQRLAPEVIEGLLFPLLDGLEQVHAIGFLHRDIKPANIMVDPQDRPTLIDFGASRAAMAGRSTTLTAIFTPGYAAAEQFVSAKQGPWTDIYGLAATLYHAITGRIPPSAIERIMQESARILRPNGLAIHSVNCGDHYAYFDRSITMINYLTYSENAWRRWNTRLLYQNRMRPGDFLCSAKRSGLEVVLERSKPRPELLAALSSLKLAPEFEQYPREQLASTSVDFAARRPC